MFNKNLIILQGCVGADPICNVTSSNKEVANFTIATNEHYLDANSETKEIVTWHRVTCWGKTAELVKNFVKKGTNIEVQGKISYKDLKLSEEITQLDESLKYVKDVVITASKIQLGHKKEE